MVWTGLILPQVGAWTRCDLCRSLPANLLYDSLSPGMWWIQHPDMGTSGLAQSMTHLQSNQRTQESCE